MKTIAFFDAKEYDKPSFEACGERYGLKFRYFETKLCEDTADLSAGCDGVCLFVNDVLSAPVIDKLTAHGITVAALRCAGYNNVDLQYAKNRLKLMRVPAYSPYAVAEHAMAMLLTSIRRTHKAYIRTRDFNFSLNRLEGFDLHGKTAGIVGTGKIGKVFIDICKGFGMKILAYDKFPGKEDYYVPLNELFEKSDVISLHCPLTEETYHIVNAESIARMKKGAVIINTSRGGLIDAEALLQGIKERKIGAACLDVYEEESDVFFRDVSGHILEDDTLALLISMPNVLVTSHQAYLTKEALENIAETTCKNLDSYFTEGTTPNEVAFSR
ncbi:MAG: 2-hydroxyacid dehydrogenase [Candidatus Borkfalkiaceae bacterium]|nr:2-hydroxyacid dehydrogenase [Clostridia bacterium]MDY6223535.1 2-hydroxyacid dehydrogenase [Christensenellaceae bacterium]